MHRPSVRRAAPNEGWPALRNAERSDPPQGRYAPKLEGRPVEWWAVQDSNL